MDIPVYTPHERARDILKHAQEEGRVPRVHPNGFVQLDGVGPTRLHVWPDDPLQFIDVQPHPIHDHVFAMRSTVVRGHMLQTVHLPELEHRGEPTHEILVAHYHTKSDSELRRTGVVVRLPELSEERFYIEAGETYEQPAFTFHTSEQDGLTVTLMEKRAVLPGSCRVLLPLGVEPLERFDRHEWHADELWEFIESALA